MRLEAKAKVNLTLDVSSLRPDGFHGIRSVMAPISLADVIDIDIAPELSFSCSVPELETESNICVRAAKAFLLHTGIKDKVSIYLQKNIPFPAGLGGGSSDAAAVLRGMNTLFGSPLNEAELYELGEYLGSDVPFCLYGACALCEGRGEVIHPLNGLPRFHGVITIGEGRLSTPEVYRALDESGAPVRNDTDAFLLSVAADDITSMLASMGNAFEPIAEKLCPETRTLRDELLALGAACAHLSGSGPSVFGIFDTEEGARNAVSSLISRGFESHICIIN